MAYRIHKGELLLDDLIKKFIEDKERPAKSFYSKYNEEELRKTQNIKEENEFLFGDIISKLFE